MSNPSIQQVTILGSTGTIGVNTLDVIAQHKDQFSVFAISAHRNVELLLKQCQQYQPKFAVIADTTLASQLKHGLKAHGLDAVCLAGIDGLQYIAAHEAVDCVMAAIVGAAGLLPTLAAVEHGKRVLLANKESLVMSGQLFMSAVQRFNAKLLPIDSEHNAIFQCLPDPVDSQQIETIWLTASGGPFLNTPIEQLSRVTPAQACQHPNWVMGKKISVDSATMMNKGLEYIEACWLFAVKPEKIRIVIHPQSIIHSMVAYIDGSVLAQMGNPDMRTPIAHGLAWPHRISSGASPLDMTKVMNLQFQAPDFERYICLKLAIEVAQLANSASIVLNAANECAVDAFLQGQIGFNHIADINRQVLDQADFIVADDIDTILEQDHYARRLARAHIKLKES